MKKKIISFTLYKYILRKSRRNIKGSLEHYVWKLV